MDKENASNANILVTMNENEQAPLNDKSHGDDSSSGVFRTPVLSRSINEREEGDQENGLQKGKSVNVTKKSVAKPKADLSSTTVVPSTCTATVQRSGNDTGEEEDAMPPPSLSSLALNNYHHATMLSLQPKNQPQRPDQEATEWNNHHRADNDIVALLPRRPASWNTFVRQGTRLKFFLEDAMQQVRGPDVVPVHKRRRVAGDSNADVDCVDDSNDPSDDQSPVVRQRHDQQERSLQLAQEKTAEVLLLQRKLKQAETHAATLEATNESLREETVVIQQRLERTAQALRIAGSNASKARQDADAAEANAATLAQTLQSLQTVVTETKRAGQLLLSEQQQVAAATAAAQAKLLQKEADLARAHKDLQTLRSSQADMEKQRQKWNEERAELERRLEETAQELDQLRRLASERDAIERARKQRADNVEQEWRQSQALLAEATAGQEQAEQTRSVLEETVAELRNSNQELHEQLSKHQESARKDKERLNESLTKAEKEAQKLRINAEAMEEEIQRNRLDKTSAEKQIMQLKTHVAGLERRLKEATSGSLVSPESNMIGLSDGIATGSALPFSLPPLQGSSGSTSDQPCVIATTPAPSTTNTCCFCFKSSFGLMKNCQCGNSKCDKRAHMSCVNRIQPGPSVSHPGTPAPRLPVVLCEMATVTLTNKKTASD